MNFAEVVRVARWLDRLGPPYIVVGGSAIERLYRVGTKDVDVLIATRAWEELDRALEGRRDATPLEPYNGTIRGTRLLLDGRAIDLEFISGEPFCGSRKPEAFVRYIRRYHSVARSGVPFADPATVWYMRLSISDWETYALKIEQDLRAGVPAATFEDTLRIADHFGVRPLMSERVASVRRVLRLFGHPRPTKDS